MVVECVQCVLKNARSYIGLISEIVLAYEGESNYRVWRSDLASTYSIYTLLSNFITAFNPYS